MLNSIIIIEISFLICYNEVTKENRKDRVVRLLELEEILSHYDIEGEFQSCEVNDSGNINRTYVVTFLKEGIKKKYLIQKINTSVFTEPYKLMKNIEGVASYFKRQMKKEKDDVHRTLDIINTKDGQLLYANPNEEQYYRIYEFIDRAIAYDCSTDSSVVFHTGKAFGHFQRVLANYPMNQLEETIKDFHNTLKRYKHLLEDIKIDPKKRAMDVAEAIVFILQREDCCSLIVEHLKTGELPLRVTHNDTKVNNVLMQKEADDFLAVIDLDTVMPGSLLYDYGDGIRSTASNAKEDETDLDKVHLNLELFQSYTDGYMSEMAPYLTKTELSLMGESIRIITLELAIRFLNDYINGDTYFKINYPNHNLDRALNQIKLVEDIESKLDYMNDYIYHSYERYREPIQDDPKINQKIRWKQNKS